MIHLTYWMGGTKFDVHAMPNSARGLSGNCEGDVPYWSTSGLSASDQAGYWRDVVCEAFTPLSPRRGRAELNRSAVNDGTPGWVRSSALTDTNCAEISSCTQVLSHGPKEVQRAPLEALFVNLQLSGSCYGEQDGRQCIVRPGSLAIFDTTRPYSLEFRENRTEGNWRALSFRIPRHRWYSAARAEGVTSLAIDTNSGAGSVAGAMMSALWRERNTLDEAMAPLERSFVDVLGAIASAQLGATVETEDEHRDSALLQIVRNHIRSAISLGRVTADSAAKEAAISARTLHRLFEGDGTTFSACVREERLRAAMDSLATAPDAVTVSEIAARWGFYDSSHLTRTFQRYLGCTPTQYREAHHAAMRPPGYAGSV